MKTRKPPLAARMADVLDRMAFGLEAVLVQVPVPPGSDPASPKVLAPSVDRLTTEARELVAEYRKGARP